ncbi:hypothetical protein evm_006641 [Chilo suppressalis]|nr:hypothetical protein evm_006641 [Chilo suppressalis]
METAYLKLKFTPLFQNLQQDTKHCLEIIPEITHVENLDKIKWKKEKSYIEYTVPVTYRIILRKNDFKTNEDLNRTYYSCVDFLPPSLDEIVESSDIKRIQSDTIILTSIPRDTERSSLTLKPPIRDKENDIYIQNGVEVQTEINRYTSITLKNPKIKGFDNKDESSVVKRMKENIVGSYLIPSIDVDEPISKNTVKTQITKITLPYINEAETEYINFETSPQFPTNGSKTDGKYKLCMSPICSIYTNDGNIINSNPVLNQAIDTLKSFVENDTKGTEYHTIFNDSFYYDIFNITTRPCKSIELQPLDNINRRRILPEERVARIVQEMEREITPLKIMLSDIIYKCSSFGFIKKNFQQSFLLNTEKQSNNYNVILKKTKTNRVVYSIVFDG